MSIDTNEMREACPHKRIQYHNDFHALCDEIDALRARVAELEHDRVRLDASLASAFQDGQGSIWPKLEAAETRIRELEAQLGAKPEGKVKT